MSIKKNHYITFTVKSPTCLLDFIMQKLDGISKNRAKAILNGNGVKVNKRCITQHNFPLKAGQIVEISRGKRKEELKSQFVKIIYEDQDIIVIEKSPGILSMGTSQHVFCVKTILDDYFHKCHSKSRAHVVHRLDRETSGVMVYAKNIEAEQILERNWHDIVTDRRYIAVLSGKMEEEHGTIANWLKDNKAYITYSSPIDNGGKYAITHFHTIQTNEHFSLVEFKLETGRKNQIRVHCLDMGHPVCGDIKYGDGNDPIKRLCLHAFRLNFYHPITGEPLSFETPIPKSFVKIFEPNFKKKKL